MQTHETLAPKKFSKSEYNRQYYRTHRSKLREKQAQVSAEVNPPILTSQIDESIREKVTGWFRLGLRTLELLALCTLTVAVTYFLVKESAGFYLESNDTIASAYGKAIAIELAAILFSFSRSRKPFLQWGQRAVVLSLCGLSVWTMSGKLVRTAGQDTSKVQALAQVVRDLETEKLEKESLRAEFFRKGRLTLTRHYEKGLSQVREKLNIARQNLAEMHSPQVIMGSVGILIAFRLLGMLINLICIHRLAEFFNLEMMHKLRT